MTPPAKPPRQWTARGPLISGFVTLLLLVGGFGGWSVLTTITGAVIASGQIEVAQNRQIVQHPDGGVVETIAISEGASVRAGDLLIRLDGSLLRSELAIVEGQLFETRARRARLEAERDDSAAPVISGELAVMAANNRDVAELVEGQVRLFRARAETLAGQMEQLSKRIGQIRSQLAGIDAQIAALATQNDLIRRELSDQQTLLDKGLAQAGRVLNLQREEARLQGQQGELSATRAQAEGRITEIEIQILGLSSTRREQASTELRDIGSAELERAERRRALLERIERLEIRAPVSGIVLGLQVTTPRSVLRAADPVLYLIPQDRPLVIAIKVPPIHIDEVFAGQSARVLLSALSSRTTPELNGRISLVSADSFTDNQTQLSYFRAEITLDAGEIARIGDQQLLPGMPVEAFIETQARTPLTYLVKPFADYFNRALRES